MEALDISNLFNSSSVLDVTSPITCSTPNSQRPKRAIDFCQVCQKNISKEGTRSQGPRRHVLQHHLCRPLFFCPHCPAKSNYDKAHIKTHMKKIHKDLGGDIVLESRENFAQEEAEWFERCFGRHKTMKNVEGKRTPRRPSSASTSSRSSSSSAGSTTTSSPPFSSNESAEKFHESLGLSLASQYQATSEPTDSDTIASSPSSSASTSSSELQQESVETTLATSSSQNPFADMPTLLPVPALDGLNLAPSDFPPGPLTPDQLILFHTIFMTNMMLLGGSALPQNPENQ